MKDLTNEVTAFAKSLEVGLFGTAENMQEAIKYAYMGIESLKDQADKIGAYTALHVVLNTVALELRRLAGDDTDLTMLGGSDE